MGILSTNKIASRSEIQSGGVFSVTLSVTAVPDAEHQASDIVMVLDRSGSMRGSTLDSLKAAAIEFISLLSGNTDTLMGQNRVGMISFANTAIIESPLTQSTAALTAGVQSLIAGGNTNTGDAFAQAQAMLSTSGAARRIMVLFTDGEPTIGVSPTPIAQLMKEEGIEIFCIGYEGTEGINEQLLKEWASLPLKEHVLIAPTEQEIYEAFENIAQGILVPGARNITIYETPNDEFEIISVQQPSLGTTQLQPNGSLNWYIPVLAKTEQETATLTFTLKDKGNYTGTLAVNKAIYLIDDAKDDPRFPSPNITIENQITEGCPPVAEVNAPPCVDSIEVDLGEINVPDQGRLLKVSLTLKNLCPQQTVSLGILVSEMTSEGEITRAFRAIPVQAPVDTKCSNLHLDHIYFVLPEKQGVCSAKKFRIRAFVNSAQGTWGVQCLEGEPKLCCEL